MQTITKQPYSLSFLGLNISLGHYCRRSTRLLYLALPRKTLSTGRWRSQCRSPPSKSISINQQRCRRYRLTALRRSSYLLRHCCFNIDHTRCTVDSESTRIMDFSAGSVSIGNRSSFEPTWLLYFWLYYRADVDAACTRIDVTGLYLYTASRQSPTIKRCLWSARAYSMNVHLTNP